jgi:fructose-bisphosphate aldolase class II/tagatose 1,6-diphosphate aldolase GatY/KbaY
MKIKDKLTLVQSGHSALLATNFYNLETLQGVVQAAQDMQKPLILQLTRSSIEYIGLTMAVQMARNAIAESGIEAWIHLDHGDAYELVERCVDAGFDSVMIDASEKPFEENIETTRKVVEMAHRAGVMVEAELGYVAKLGQSDKTNGFTDPWQAKYFVEATGVDTLAVAIGSAHGFYMETPKLDLERLSLIHSLIPNPLVLHGGSGIPDNTLIEAIKRGICKINLATEIKNAFMKKIKADLSQGSEIDIRKVFPSATATVVRLVSQKLHIVSQ